MLQLELNKLFQIVSEYRRVLHTDIPNLDTVKSFSKILKPAINAFVKSVPSANIKDFIQQNDVELFRIHDTLCGEYARTRLHQSARSLLQSEHDKFFGSLGIKNPKKHFQHIVTKIFNEFIKGITFFETNDSLGNPLYHRIDSCGDADVPGSSKFKASLLDSKLSKERKAKITKICYLERLIYNSIFTNIFNYQDIGHLMELRNMEATHELNIKIKYSGDNMYPESLAIYIQNRNFVETENYVKKWKSNIVHCTRNYKALHFDKVQSFEKEEPWLLIE